VTLPVLMSLAYKLLGTHMSYRKVDFYQDFENISHSQVLELFSHSNDINEPDATGDSPLLYACKSKDIELILFLLGKGADPNFVSASGMAPLHVTINEVELNEVFALSAANALVHAGADIELRAFLLKTPFLLACCRNSKAMIEFLVMSGCDTNAVTFDIGDSLNGLQLASISGVSADIKSYIKTLV